MKTNKKTKIALIGAAAVLAFCCLDFGGDDEAVMHQFMPGAQMQQMGGGMGGQMNQMNPQQMQQMYQMQQLRQALAMRQMQAAQQQRMQGGGNSYLHKTTWPGGRSSYVGGNGKTSYFLGKNGYSVMVGQ